MELSEWHMWWKQRGARELRRILMEEWDPIGVRDVPEAQDEYDSYLGPIAGRLRSGETPEEVATYLDGVTEGWMGLGDPKQSSRLAREANLATARSLVKWYEEETWRSPPVVPYGETEALAKGARRADTWWARSLSWTPNGRGMGQLAEGRRLTGLPKRERS